MFKMRWGQVDLRQTWIALCAFFAIAAGAWADAAEGPASSQPDKSGFTLFNPTPRALMRAFNPDRPSVTEGPFTIDAGHLQTELSFVEYTYDYDSGVRTDGFAVLPTELRLGVLNNLEAELVVTPYVNQRTGTGVLGTRLWGFGDTALRAKLNLWGNDGGTTAGAILPFVRFPTASGGLSNHHVEGGILLPFALQLPADFSLGSMAEFDVNRNAANTGYGVDFVHSVTVGHALTKEVAAYVEYVGVSPIGTGHTYLAFFDTGLTWLLGADVQLDTGINIGLSRRANDFTVFAGLSFRL